MPRNLKNSHSASRKSPPHNHTLLIISIVIVILFVLLTVVWVKKPTRLSSGAASTPAPQVNLVRNGSFEHDGDNNGMPDLWQGKNTEANDKITNTTSSFESRSFMFTLDSGPDEWISQTITGNWPAGQLMQLSYSFKGENLTSPATPSVIVETHTIDKTIAGASFVLPAGTYGWRGNTHKFQFLYPSNRIVIKLKAGRPSGRVWFDAVNLMASVPQQPSTSPKPSGVYSPTPTRLPTLAPSMRTPTPSRSFTPTLAPSMRTPTPSRSFTPTLAPSMRTPTPTRSNTPTPPIPSGVILLQPMEFQSE